MKHAAGKSNTQHYYRDGDCSIGCDDPIFGGLDFDIDIDGFLYKTRANKK